MSSPRQLLETLRSSFNDSPERILIIDPKTGKIVHANDTYLGQYPEDTLETLRKKHILADLNEEWEITKKIRKLLAEGAPFSEIGRRLAAGEQQKYDLIHTVGKTYRLGKKPAFHVLSSITIPATEVEKTAFETAGKIQQDFLRSLQRSLASRHAVSGAHVQRQADLGVAAFAELHDQLGREDEKARNLADAFRHRFPNVTNPQMVKLLDRRQLSLVQLYALVHDLGKIGIPDDILTRDTTKKPYTQKEWRLMTRGHMVETRKLVVHGIGLAEGVEPTEGIAIGHHEMPSGKGYPLGKMEPDLTIGDTIGKLVDVFDVMTSKREYKRASRTPKPYLLEVARKAGSHGDFAFESARWFVDHFPQILGRYVGRIQARMEDVSGNLQSIRGQIKTLEDDHAAFLSDEEKIMAKRDYLRAFRGYGRFSKTQTVAYEKKIFRNRLSQLKNDLTYFQKEYNEFKREYDSRSRWLNYKYQQFNEYRKDLGLSPWLYQHERQSRGGKRRE